MMEKVLRIGVVGLGRRWHKRYRPALRRLSKNFSIRAVCDQIPQRAAWEAKRLACDAAAGPTQLLEREDVEAVLLLDQQWFGLWPLELACQLGKPVLCSCALAADDARADALHHQINDSCLPVMIEMLPRFAPATESLQGLFTTHLGAPRLLFCDIFRCGCVASPGECISMPDPRPILNLVGSTGIPLLDWCAGVFGGEPLNVTARSLERSGFSSLFMEFAGQRGVQMTRRQATCPEGPTVRLQILAERGSAVLELPSRISWTSSEASHTQVFRGQLSSTTLLLSYFRAVVQERAALRPTFADAYRVVRWLRVAVKSRDEGRLLNIPG
jgi:predicted dehydrogenase